MTTTTKDIQLVAVPVDQVHNFRCLLVHRDTKQEICELIQIKGDRFCNVLAEINQRFPGFAVFETWEVELPEPDEF